MLHFLRRIRRRLINSGSMSKYILYAIGEIALVVIGILIALQVNNWNESRKLRNIEISYFKALKNDLGADLRNLEIAIEDKFKKSSSALELLDFQTPTSIRELMVFDSLIFNVFIWHKFTPSSNTLNEMTSSGKLGIIGNDTIKNMLLDLQQQNEYITMLGEHMRHEYDNYLYDRSAEYYEHFPFQNLKELALNDKWVISGNISDDKRNRLVQSIIFLLKDTTFRNGLTLAAGNNAESRRALQKMYGDIEKLIELINEDIQ